ncbi:hypothetical protein CBM2586_A110040 [Cupriavidus phytorum]|uniref:Uncharacterized protein n=1 Tax=Cupriavidus taiwanensis TaxID=164546 RepID=A0A375BZY4_9BURK|nr:hypothetical protein CBM2586_A110040 [Cupriavidus taiwanensis]
MTGYCVSGPQDTWSCRPADGNRPAGFFMGARRPRQGLARPPERPKKKRRTLAGAAPEERLG